jgi:hypothetical protein
MKRLLVTCLALLVCGPVLACSCGRDERWLAAIEKEDQVLPGDVFHGRQKRWISPTAIEVEVIESIAGEFVPSGTTKVLRPDDSYYFCGSHVRFEEAMNPRPGVTAVYFAKDDLVYPCYLMRATPETLVRLRELAKEPLIPGLPRFRINTSPWGEIVIGLLGACLMIALIIRWRRTATAPTSSPRPPER